MNDTSEKNLPYQVRPSSISFGEGPPQLVVYLEHISEALAYVRKNKIVSIEVDTHCPQKQPLEIDFSFLQEIPNLIGLECRMNISKKTDLSPLHRIEGLKQLAWPARTTPEINLSCFPRLEYLSFRHLPSTQGWDALSDLKVLRLSVSGGKNLKFLKNLKSLTKMEVADSSIESMEGIEGLDLLEEIKIFILPKLIDISSVGKCRNLKRLYVDKTKRLADYSPLGQSQSIETLTLLTPVNSVEFVPHIKSLKNFFCRAVNSGDLSPLLRAKSLKYLDIYPDKRSYVPRLAEVKQSLGI